MFVNAAAAIGQTALTDVACHQAVFGITALVGAQLLTSTHIPWERFGSGVEKTSQQTHFSFQTKTAIQWPNTINKNYSGCVNN